MHRLYFIYAPKASWKLRTNARKNYATVEIHLHSYTLHNKVATPFFEE